MVNIISFSHIVRKFSVISSINLWYIFTNLRVQNFKQEICSHSGSSVCRLCGNSNEARAKYLYIAMNATGCVLKLEQQCQGSDTRAVLLHSSENCLRGPWGGTCRRTSQQSALPSTVLLEVSHPIKNRSLFLELAIFCIFFSLFRTALYHCLSKQRDKLL